VGIANDLRGIQRARERIASGGVRLVGLDASRAAAADALREAVREQRIGQALHAGGAQAERGGRFEQRIPGRSGLPWHAESIAR
jgi:hypothetical protein